MSHFNFPVCHMPKADWNCAEWNLVRSPFLAQLQGSKLAASFSHRLQRCVSDNKILQA